MSKITRPMLAATLSPEDTDNIKYPVYGTPKLDGIRCLFLDKLVKSRKLKKIPNTYIRNELEKSLCLASKNSEIFSGEFDGEIVSSKDFNFQESTHNIMSFDGQPEFIYYIFDVIEDDLTVSYEKRMELLESITFNDPRIVKLLPKKLNNKQELLDFEEECLNKGFEGIIIRSDSGPYKLGRSTNKEGYLLKLKRFSDSEARITGFEELMENTAASTINALGLKEKTSKKDDMVGKGTLGTIVAVDIYTGVELRVGSGLNDEMRREIWDNQAKYLNSIFKYKYFAVGVKDKPRHPVWLGLRADDDMD